MNRRTMYDEKVSMAYEKWNRGMALLPERLRIRILRDLQHANIENRARLAEEGEA